MSDLDEAFAQAQQDVTALSADPGNEAKLDLYALYKQATVGDVTGEAVTLTWKATQLGNFMDELKICTAYDIDGKVTEDFPMTLAEAERARARADEARLAAVFAAADLMVLPYREGSQSAMAPLALAHGVPIHGTHSSVIGGFSGNPEGAAITAVAASLGLVCVHGAVCFRCGTVDARIKSRVTRKQLWVAGTAIQALNRNTRLIVDGTVLDAIVIRHAVFRDYDWQAVALVQEARPPVECLGP